MIGRTNVGGGGVGGGIPSFTYTGDYKLIDDGDKNWRIKFLTSGTLMFQNIGNAKGGIDVFCVGGGGSGGYSEKTSYGAAGGGGGYTTTVKGISVDKDTPYKITIGAGGAAATTAKDGNPTSAFNVIANGGKGVGTVSDKQKGGAGGSGGGSSARWGKGAAGGSNGSNGGNQSSSANNWIAYGGSGQGTTTREFGEATGDLYAGGGGGGGGGDDDGIAGGAGGAGGGGKGSAYAGGAGTSGSANTGGGGGGNGGGWAGSSYGGSGGSGIVVIRNSRRS